MSAAFWFDPAITHSGDPSENSSLYQRAVVPARHLPAATRHFPEDDLAGDEVAVWTSRGIVNFTLAAMAWHVLAHLLLGRCTLHYG